MGSKDDYARAIIAEGKRRGISPLGIQIGLATVYVESDFIMYANEDDPESLNYPHEALSEDANSTGLFQQRAPWWGTVADRMDATRSAGLFFAALAKLDYNNPARSPGSYAQAVQKSAFPDRYDKRFNDAVALYNRLEASVVVDRPDFNEYPIWSDNNQSRGGVKVDLFLLHTQEGDSNADQLARYCGNPAPGGDPKKAVSYHYTVSEDAHDHGVTVVDVVDTDYASWSVGNANNRSINLCFAGSRAAWTRQDWLAKAPKAIATAAYLAAQDCKKYGIKPFVIVPPYDADPPGISDHRYVTEHLGWGTHTDVGDGFPWDVFIAAVNKYSGNVTVTPGFTYPSTEVMIREIWEQLRGPEAKGWPQLGKNAKGENLSLVDAIAKLVA
ncbi:metalloendopeptidase-like membrane protein [Mycobacteroides abscessus subsp. abscessus]|uniref:N-acetylmuramoyl-L-alanine amidase n=1 Tax=Mycobacteroides abscessus TaxID=36809 RepID=UPI0009A5CF2E|nr:N-acetylmuramoyl-L-alanine amidase [Mycobacteroides abscessus]SKU47439.1 metalloendopeptidase-like membrane protein [Mycobacteroides abscessus subsp. abscessus]